jgi:hypothetical protein
MRRFGMYRHDQGRLPERPRRPAFIVPSVEGSTTMIWLSGHVCWFCVHHKHVGTKQRIAIEVCSYVSDAILEAVRCHPFTQSLAAFFERFSAFGVIRHGSGQRRAKRSDGLRFCKLVEMPGRAACAIRRCPSRPGKTKAPRKPGRSQNSTSQRLRQRSRSA